MRIDQDVRPNVTLSRGASLETFARELHEAASDIKDALRACGSLVLKGTPITTPADLGTLADAFSPDSSTYREKATPRSKLAPGIFSSTDLPRQHAIRQHNENSYTLTFPGYLIFGCLEAPRTGGATPTCDVRDVLDRIDKGIMSHFHDVGWKLIRHFPDQVSLSWRDAYGVETIEQLHEYAAANSIEVTTTDDGRFRTEQTRSAVITAPHSSRASWFNHVAFWSSWSLEEEVREALQSEYGAALPFETTFGDGTPIEREVIEHLNECYDAGTVRSPWEGGDVLIVDNLISSHGRDPFEGSRRIAVAMKREVAVMECEPTVALGVAAR